MNVCVYVYIYALWQAVLRATLVAVFNFTFDVFVFKEKFVQVYQQQAEEKRRRDAEKMDMLTGDPFDPEVRFIPTAVCWYDNTR